jgi:hypothetical protein
VLWGGDLLEPDTDQHVTVSLIKDFNLGAVAYLAALALVSVGVPLSLALTLAVKLFFARPARKRRAAKATGVADR